jgi:hypothetical protein
MMLRRTFLKLFGGLLALVATKPVADAIAAPAQPSPPLEHFAIVLPPWCPQGFVPEVGQTISARQFPALFERDGKFWPPYHGKQFATLPYNVTWPDLSKPWAHGYQDRLTRVARFKPDDRVMVGLVATMVQIASNGRRLKPGWGVSILVPPEDFLRAYFDAGPQGPVANSVMEYFDGYENVNLGTRT